MLALFLALVLGQQAPPADPQLAVRIATLLHTVLTDDGAAAGARSEARTLFAAQGLVPASEVGSDAAYAFVVVTCGSGPSDVQARVLAQAKRLAVRGQIPTDAELFCAASLTQQRAKEKADAKEPRERALRDEIEKLFDSDQAVRKRTVVDASAIAAVDREHELPLTRIFSRFGVPTYSMVGSKAAADFIVMVQHQSPGFRAKVLPQLKANVDRGQADPESYALVFDRSASDAGKKQRYGENLVCTPENPRMRPAPIEDPEHVDVRRAALGLIRLDLYVRTLEELAPQFFCAAVSPAK